MDSNVTEMNPAGQLDSFFESMFAAQKGYVYCPTTEPNNASECDYVFFKWPEESEDLTRHVLKTRTEREVYFSPVLFKKPELSKENIYGTKYVWAEFNGETPDVKTLKDFPTPSFKIRTSQPGHEYWFWQLQFFEKDMSKIQDMVRRIAFFLKADLSAWHHECVFRPPATIHHRSGLRTFMFENHEVIHAAEVFQELPDPPKYLTEDNFKDIPNVQEVIAVHKWSPEDWRFFYKKEIPVGKRFKALTRLAFICAEMGMSNPEILAILMNADGRWKHFSDRKPEQRKARLIALINHVRTKKPVEAYRDVNNEYPIYNFTDFMATDFEVKWLMEPFLEDAGMVMITGDSNVGKTRFTLMFCIHAALGWDFLGWKCPRPLKIQFWSLEMTHGPLKKFLTSLTSHLGPEELKMLGENFYPVPIGHSVHLDKPAQQPKAKRLIHSAKPDIIAIDSLGVAVQDDIENQKVVNGVLDFVNKEIRSEIGASVIWIHHHRKHGSGKPTVDDIFGSVYLRNQMTGIWTLHRVKTDPVKGDIIEVVNTKQRLTEVQPKFKIRSDRETIGYTRLDDLGFKAKTEILESIEADDDILKGFMGMT